MNYSWRRAVQALIMWLTTPFGTFIAVGLIGLIAFNCLIPAGIGPDESRHIFRVAGIASGQILPVHFGNYHDVPLWGSRIPDSLLKALSLNGLPTAPNFQYNAHYFQSSFNTQPRSWAEFPNTLVYSPIAYIPALCGYIIANWFHTSILTLIIVMRITDSFFYLLAVSTILHLASRQSIKWLVCVISLLPVNLFTASTVTADIMTNVSLLAFSVCWISLLDSVGNTRPGTVSGLLSSSITIALVKPTYFPIVLLLVFVSSIAWWKRLVTFFGSSLLALVWYKLSSAATTGMGLMRQGEDRFHVNSNAQLTGILHDPINYVRVIFHTLILNGDDWLSGTFGQLGYWSRGILSVSLIGTIPTIICIVVICQHLPKLKLNCWILFSTLFLLVIIPLIIITTIYLTFTPAGRPYIEGVQGRYFAPLLLLGCFAVTQLLQKHSEPSTIRTGVVAADETFTLNARALMFIFMLLSLIFTLATYRSSVLLPSWLP